MEPTLKQGDEVENPLVQGDGDVVVAVLEVRLHGVVKLFCRSHRRRERG